MALHARAAIATRIGWNAGSRNSAKAARAHRNCTGIGTRSENFWKAARKDRFPPGGTGLTLAAALRHALAGQAGPDVVAVHARDEVEADLLRAHRLALAVAGAGAEAFLVHLRDHVAHAAEALRLSL